MKTHYVTFRSITFAQRGERAVRQGGMDCVLQRTPRWMEERGCGYCIRIRPGDTQRVVQRLQSGGIPFSKVYARKEGGGVEEVTV